MSSSSAPQGTSPDARRSSPARLVTVGALSWFVPGAGHLMTGQTAKGVTFFVTLLFMFGVGLAFNGRLFPFQVSDPLVFLAALGQWGLGLPRLAAGVAGFGGGKVIAATYEYGNTFLIVAGLLNSLVVLDASDFAAGRKVS